MVVGGPRRVRVSPPDIGPDLISIRSLHLECNSHSDSDSGALQSTLGTVWGWGTGTVAAAALAESLDKPFPWAVGFFFDNTELCLELWTVIAAISGFDD